MFIGSNFSACTLSIIFWYGEISCSIAVCIFSCGVKLLLWEEINLQTNLEFGKLNHCLKTSCRQTGEAGDVNKKQIWGLKLLVVPGPSPVRLQSREAAQFSASPSALLWPLWRPAPPRCLLPCVTPWRCVTRSRLCHCQPANKQTNKGAHWLYLLTFFFF